MADDVDIANKYAQDALDAQLAAAQSRLKRTNKPNPTHCTYCDGKIPDARRSLDWHVETCVSCAEAKEREH